MESSGGYVGLLSFCSFAFSVIAAVLAIDLYALLRTGRSGSTWRVLIIASVMFALMHALRLAEILNFGLFPGAHLSEIVELMFVMAMAYAFYLQRKVFGPRERLGSPRSTEEPRRAPRAPDEASDPAPANAARPDKRKEVAPSSAPASESARVELDSQDDEEAAASEWARLNGQSDHPAPRRAQRVNE